MKLNFFLIVLSFSYGLSAQQWIKSDSIVLDQSILCSCINVNDEIFLGTQSGVIIKSGLHGEIVQEFSYPNTGLPTQIDCANPLKVFVFFNETQSYLIIDRFTVSPKIYNLSSKPGERIEQATLAADQSIWSVSYPSISLSREDISGKSTLYFLTSLISEDETVSQLLALGKQIVLVTNKKLHYFNLAGQYLGNQVLSTPAIIQPSKSNGYYLYDKKLYTISAIEPIAGPFNVDSNYQIGALINPDLCILINDNQGDFYFMR